MLLNIICLSIELIVNKKDIKVVEKVIDIINLDIIKAIISAQATINAVISFIRLLF